MKTRLTSLMAATALAVVIGQAPALAQGLTGKVSSAAEGANGSENLEGVVISAKKGIVTVSVVSNAKGEFSFPAGKLGAGDYALSIRAAGYDLEAPTTVTIAGDKPASLDLKLTKTKNLAAQLSNLEWILSVPGTDAEKRALTGCTNCHTVERIVTSKYTAAEMLDVIKRMAQYSNNSFYKKPQIRAEARDINRFVPNADKVAAYFASINRSKGEQSYELKTVPRVSGDGTRVVITEYDLPDQTIQPHDVITDKDGIVWHSDFSGQILGRFDTKTLEHKSFKVPLQRDGWPTGALDLETDPQGNLWLGLMFQSGTAKFDVKTEQFQMFSIPQNMIKPDSQTALIGVQNWTVDNKNLDRRIQPGAASIGSTCRAARPSCSSRSRAGQARPTRSRPTRRTISGSSISAAPISAASTPSPGRWRSTRRRPSARARAAAGSTTRAGCGLPSSSASASGCSIPRPRSSRSGRCRASSSRLMTPRLRRMGMCGPPA